MLLPLRDKERMKRRVLYLHVSDYVTIYSCALKKEISIRDRDLFNFSLQALENCFDKSYVNKKASGLIITLIIEYD